MLAVPSISADHLLLGHGECLSWNYTKFERFTADQIDSLYVNDMSECACPECANLCDATPACIGYEFNCCLKNGQKCIADGHVLFSQGTRPEGEPIRPFRTLGYYDSPTTGPEFLGVGTIMHVAIPANPSLVPQTGGAGCFGKDHVLLGHGECLSWNYTKFERFTADQIDSLYVNDMSECACPECANLCDATPACIGYEFNCCLKNGQKCIADGHVLFSQGTRPEGEPIRPFRTLGYYDSPTTGPEFLGVGTIMHVAIPANPSLVPQTGGAGCYGKVSNTELV